MGDKRSIADMALLPFVRQFAHVDKSWFEAQPISYVHKWLNDFLASDIFLNVMSKYDPWKDGTTGVDFPIP